MKKVFVISLLSMVLLLIASGCNQEEKPSAEKKETVFNENDKERAIEMIETLNERLVLLENEANTAILKGEIEVGDNNSFTQRVDEKSDEIVFQPFLEKYPESLISDRGALKVTYTPKSSDGCAFGNCNYDSIEVFNLQVDEEEWDIYKSKEFKITELVFSNVEMSFSNEQESESTYISFVKGETGDLYFSFNPIIKSLNFNAKQWDEDFLTIKSEVPESEIETEENAFRQEVEEVLAEYPPLQ